MNASGRMGERQKRGGGGGLGRKGCQNCHKHKIPLILKKSCRWTDKQYLSVLEDKEPHVLPVVHLILTEDGRSKVLDPHARQLVTIDVVVLKTTLHWEGEVRGKATSHEG